MTAVVTRGNTVAFSFVFYDATGAEATPDSAQLELSFVARDGYRKETLDLTESGGSWIASWDSSVSKGGWVGFHAHAHAGDAEMTQDGRFKLSANRANLEHDRLPGSSRSTDYAT